MNKPKFTVEQIKEELARLAPSLPISQHYLEREIERRVNSGRPKSSDLSRQEQLRVNSKNYRDRKKK